MRQGIWIAAAGAVGTACRYYLSVWLGRVSGEGFPWGTLCVNVVGCFLIGLLMRLSESAPWLTPTLRLTLTTGLLGGFTTFSAFGHETLAMVRLEQPGLAVLYVLSNVLGGVLAVWLGRLVAHGVA